MLKRWTILTATATACLPFTSIAFAQDHATSRPLLEQLDRESRSLVRELQQGIVRVELPAPLWMREIAARENPLIRWGPELNDELKKRLVQELENPANGRFVRVNAELMPATQPASTTLPAGTDLLAGGNIRINYPSPTATGPSQSMVLVPGVTPDGRRVMQLVPARNAVTNTVGLLLDTQGHLLIPLYVEREAIGQNPVKITMADGQTTTAKFVGSDRPTNLTILQMDQPEPAAHPLRLGDSKPADGSLVMVLAPNNGAAHLSLWAGGQGEFGVVAGMDGAISGINRNGQFLTVKACSSVIDQLIATGTVKRAILGVTISEVRPEDPMRQQISALGRRPAMLIHDVQPNPDLPAQRAGLKSGDLILSLAGREVSDTPNFAAAMSSLNGKTDVQILRDGQAQTIQVDLEAK